MVYIVCGVSGTGKTTIGKQLADQFGLPFYDADDFHSRENVDKMANGIPLNDQDREEWLNTLGEMIQKWNAGLGAVLACSALKKSYREILANGHSEVTWIALEGEKQLVLSRLKDRKGHYFDSALLDSQLEIYSRPKEGMVFNVKLSPEEIVTQIVQRLATE